MTMPRTIYCPDCGVSLNVPEAAAGRRLKCPKCGVKFTADGGASPQRPASSPGAKGDLGRASSITLPASSGHGDFDLPTSSGSLRDTFDLPLLGEEPSRSQTPHTSELIADPLALLKDEGVANRRRQTAAEGRAKARRCPTCGSVVPQGMSICGTCGLDLETGARIDLADELGTLVGPRRPSGPPIGVWIVGMISMAASVIFAIISLLKWQGGQAGYVFLLLVCLFGGYAALQFLRSKSVKLLLIALTLGVVVNVIALIALPVYNASIQVDVHQKKVDPNSPDDEDIAITNISERLDINELSWGIAILVTYAAVSLYLNSPSVHRYFR